MCQTLFSIPHDDKWLHIPICGFGWLLLVWSLFSLIVLVSAARHASTSRAVMEWGPFLLIVALVILFVLPAVELPAADGASGGGLAIRGYGVMLGLAIVSALALAVWRARTRDIASDLILSLGTWLVVCGIAGGRVFYLIQYWGEYRDQNFWKTLGHALNFSQGGLVVYGAFIGGFLAFAYYVWRHRLPFLKFADLVVPSLMLGLAIGRIGCFCNGCCYGGPTDHWWGVRFPTASVPYAEHHSSGRLHGFQIAESSRAEVVVVQVMASGPATRVGLPVGAVIRKIDDTSVDDPLQSYSHPTTGRSPGPYEVARALLAAAGSEIKLSTDRGEFRWRVEPWPTHTEPIQPTQLYSAVTAGLICCWLLVLEPFLRWPGALFGVCLSLYPAARFLLESIRVDEGSFAGTGLSIAQNMSIAIFVVSIGFWFYLWSQVARFPGKAKVFPT